MKTLFEPLRGQYWCETAMLHLEEKKPFLIAGAGDSVQNHLAASFHYFTGRNVLVVTPNELTAKEVYEEIRFYDPEGTYYFPAKDPLFYSVDAKGLAVEQSRMSVLRALREEKVRLLVLSAESFFDRMVPQKIWQSFVITAKIEDELPLEELLPKLRIMGYERTEQIESPGQFSVRGGIVDIFPIADEMAIRIELWGDEIDSMRLLDPQTQRSGEKMEEVTIYPVTEILVDDAAVEEGKSRIQKDLQEGVDRLRKEGMDEEAKRLQDLNDRFLDRLLRHTATGLESYVSYFYDQTVSVLDYVSSDTVLCFEEPARIKERLKNLHAELQNSLKDRLRKGYLMAAQLGMFPELEEITETFEGFSRVFLCSLLSSSQDAFPFEDILHLKSRTLNVLDSTGSAFVEELRSDQQMGYQTLVLADNSLKAQRLSSMLSSEGLNARCLEDLDQLLSKGEIGVARGTLKRGFSYPEAGLAVVSMQEMTQKGRRPSKRRKFKEGQRIDSFEDIKAGDYVVHENHGVGIYQGVVQMEDEDTKRDYFKIAYRDGGVLYVPTTSLDMLQKYVAAEGAKPRLNDLNGNDWQRTKARVRAGVAKLAEDLVKLYADRQNRQGFSFDLDSPWQREFEESFPYEETDDQKKAIEDTKKDMESAHIMDRLICGDVGYGKTEVAIRAAFKAVQSGKQVALLAPTTILAQQHYNTFVSRMREYPVRVGLLSRFNTPKQTKAVVTGIKDGRIDIVIGTHRLLGKDIHFKDMGLLIIDEEQRFGVGHKEKIKALKKDIDVLTLTATPIPRTLHMGLTGMRDMSLLREAPMDRHPVQTYVMEADDQMIREAIYRELGRGGQVFYLHNRVSTIDETASKVQSLVPEAKVVMAHGQMNEHELEDRMMRFVEGDVDVLVCTTIIETGLDIPNANTIIVENADTMGLAQLYQLRGRVGRSNRIAYAYFLYRRGKVLQEEAQKRLEAIGELTDFGSGYKIALRDLEIRGAGNVLGPEQHGHMGAVGYELYCKLLQEAIREISSGTDSKAEGNSEQAPAGLPDFETTIHIKADAYLPSSYIQSERQKLDLYKRIAGIRSEEDKSDMIDELIDRYGDLPRCVNNLLTISLIKALASSIGCEMLDYNGEVLSMQLRDDAPIDMVPLTQYLAAKKGEVRLQSDKGKQRLILRVEKSSREQLRLQRILAKVEEVAALRRGGTP